jgi:hypothetical protein
MGKTKVVWEAGRDPLEVIKLDAFWAKYCKGNPCSAPDTHPHVPPSLARSGMEGGICWIWMGADDGRGYGRCYVPGTLHKYVPAHPLAFRLANGRPPVGVTRHDPCDNPPCGNPAHLKEGTAAQNSADMVKRGRSASGDRSTARLYPERQGYYGKRIDYFKRKYGRDRPGTSTERGHDLRERFLAERRAGGLFDPPILADDEGPLVDE